MTENADADTVLRTIGRSGAGDVDFDMLVDDVMSRWPETIRVFLDFRFMCVGCPIACFHTVADASREHFANPDKFLAALREAIETEGA